MYDLVIIGGGVIGSMIARQLSKKQIKICVLEKENDVGMGASKANSGIVHGGFDPEPNTLKAKLNSVGVEKLFSAAKELNVPIKRNGSLVCAFGKEEEGAIKELYSRGIQNKITGMEVISGDEARALEPNLSGDVTLALKVPSAGIVCPYELTLAAMGNAMDNGVELLRNFKVTNIKREQNLFKITSQKGHTVTAKYLVNCAGAYSHKISELAGDNSFKIIPRAGEYMLLDKAEGNRVSHTIFQVPTKQGKGILVTPTVDGNLLTGPTAGVVQSPENTETTLTGLKTVEQLAKKSVPSVNFRQVITSFSGVRSSEKNGDFIIKFSSTVKNLLNVAAIDSPGLTCSVSIADYVVELLEKSGLNNPTKTNFNPNRPDPHFFRKMNDDEKDAFIKQNPHYGRIICRCEGVSEGEIKAAVKTNPKALDVDGVKRRTRSGMGRCQGGFCMPYVMRIISEETKIPMEEITKKGEGSNLLSGRI
jgi:glycerol-3-phosphate dehydrogenase